MKLLDELSYGISDIAVPWKLHDKQSVITGTLKGDIYGKNQVALLYDCPDLSHCVDQPHKFFGGMGDGNIVMLAFRPLLGKISGKGSIP